eukprot:TRINITY_DN103069_c0_g1_i1.p1 TRINITY_DN103069_c0_g1~~TRINITY_DN103069_c0_g1_i1.p1  ORF type:complete len:280 (-),score=50.82 TRINITY_DN103069_c0_g1_i1:483-1268(-)
MSMSSVRPSTAGTMSHLRRQERQRPWRSQPQQSLRAKAASASASPQHQPSPDHVLRMIDSLRTKAAKVDDLVRMSNQGRVAAPVAPRRSSPSPEQPSLRQSRQSQQSGRSRTSYIRPAYQSQQTRLAHSLRSTREELDHLSQVISTLRSRAGEEARLPLCAQVQCVQVLTRSCAGEDLQDFFCPICHDDDVADVVELLCGNRHQFHQCCIDNWITAVGGKTVICPMCRETVQEAAEKAPDAQPARSQPAIDPTRRMQRAST